jgi:GINS complex subunit 2
MSVSVSVLSECELEYICEWGDISIMPSITLPLLHLAFVSLLSMSMPYLLTVCVFSQGSYGPFRAQVPATVPIWLALELKKCKRCRIIPPDWLDKTHLESVVEREKRETLLCAVPEHFIELAYLLFKQYSDYPISQFADEIVFPAVLLMT